MAGVFGQVISHCGVGRGGRGEEVRVGVGKRVSAP